jgi:hypothetical protein
VSTGEAIVMYLAISIEYDAQNPVVRLWDVSILLSMDVGLPFYSYTSVRDIEYYWSP